MASRKRRFREQEETGKLTENYDNPMTVQQELYREKYLKPNLYNEDGYYKNRNEKRIRNHDNSIISESMNNENSMYSERFGKSDYDMNDYQNNPNKIRFRDTNDEL